jgi:Bacterial regulatory proteins, luxR family
VRVLKIRVFLVIENRLLRDVLARLLRRQVDVELSGKGGSGETNPGEVAKSGSDNKEIAEELHLSEYTVKNHMSRILKQMDAVDRSEAVKTVRECGYEMSL